MKIFPIFVYLLVLASSILVGAAFWIESLWFMMLFAMLPFFYAIDGAKPKKAFLTSALFIAVAGLTTSYPLLKFRTVQSVMPNASEFSLLLLVAALHTLVIASIALVLFWVGFAFLKKPLARVAFLSLGWVGFEILRSKLTFGLTWMSAGEPLIEFLPLGIYARIGGIYLLSFLIALFNVTLYESIKYLLAEKETSRRLIPLITTTAIFVLLVAGGAIYFNRTQSVKTGKTISVAVVQVGTMFNYRPEEKDYYNKLHIKTREVLAKEKLPKADLIILPANYIRPATEEDVLQNKTREDLAFLPQETTLLFGTGVKRGGLQYENTILSSPQREVQTTSKEYLFPFVEYFPLGSDRILPKLKKFTTQYSPGENKVLSLENGVKFGVLFCSEEFVPQLARKARQNGADLLVISGNTDDFASPLAFKEVLRAGRLRALENNIYVIHALKSGVSAVIDPSGRVLKQLSKDEEGILYANIAL